MSGTARVRMAARRPAFAEWPAVTIQVSKKPGENASTVADAVMLRIGQLKGQLIPADVAVVETRNYGATANDKANQLIKKLIFATLSVVALVWVSLGRREALIVGSAVVLTLASTLFASWAWGFTLNRVSLFALIFSIGILVDDAIVVVENIHRRSLIDHLPLAEVIPRAVDEVGGPTILATFTVIAALLPMAFVTGLMGPYMAPIPINSSMGMLLSLAIAFVITPWLALRLLPAAHGTPTSGDKLGRRLSEFFERVMRPFLRGDAGRPQRRWLGLGIAGAIAVSVLLVPLNLVVLKMLPFDNKSEFQIVLDMPTGSPVEATAAVLREMAVEVAKLPEVTDYQAYAGLSAPINFNGLVRQYYLRTGGEVGDLQVNLVDKHERKRKSHEIAQAVRPALDSIAKRHGGDVKVVEVPPGPPVLSPIVAEIYGPDAEAQMKLAKQVRAVFEATPDITAIDDTVLDPAERIVLRVDTAKAAQYGIPAAEIARIARLALASEDITPLHDGASKYSVPVRIGLADSAKGSLDALLKMKVRGPDTVRDEVTGLPYEIPLSELVRPITLPHERVLYRKDLQPVVYVTGDVAGGAGKTDSPLYGMFAMREAISKIASPGRAAAGGALDRAAGRSLLVVRAQVGRRVAGHLRDLPRHGHCVCRRPGADLPAGGGAVPLVPDAARHHGADSADDHRRAAGPRPAGCAVHRDLDDRHDRAGRHHRAQLDPAGGLHPPAPRRRGRLPGRHDRGRRHARQADRPDRRRGDARRSVHPRRPDLQRTRHFAAVRHLRLDGADAGADSGAVLRRQLPPAGPHRVGPIRRSTAYYLRRPP